MKITDLVLLSLFMCSNVMVQHYTCPLALGSAEVYFQFTQNEPMTSESVKVSETRHRLAAISQKEFYTIILFLAYISEFASLITKSYLELHKMVIGKQCRLRSDAR